MADPHNPPKRRAERDGGRAHFRGLLRNEERRLAAGRNRPGLPGAAMEWMEGNGSVGFCLLSVLKAEAKGGRVALAEVTQHLPRAKRNQEYKSSPQQRARKSFPLLKEQCFTKRNERIHSLEERRPLRGEVTPPPPLSCCTKASHLHTGCTPSKKKKKPTKPTNTPKKKKHQSLNFPNFTDTTNNHSPAAPVCTGRAVWAALALPALSLEGSSCFPGGSGVREVNLIWERVLQLLSQLKVFFVKERNEGFLQAGNQRAEVVLIDGVQHSVG